MIKRFLIILLLAGCSSGAASKEGTILNTSSTSSNLVNTLPSEDITYTPVEYAFFDDAEYYYSINPSPEQKIVMLETGYLLCQLMDEGMTDKDIVERINEAGTDAHQRRIDFSIAIAATTTLCRSHIENAEYISINFPL